MFGVVDPSQLIAYHTALLLAGISSPLGMLIVFVSWMLYGVKAHFFIRQKMALAQYNFINETGTLEKNAQLKLWMAFYCVILLPIIIYVFALIGLSAYHHLFISLICIVIVFSALAFGLSFLSYRSVTFGFLKQDRQQSISFIKIKRPYYSWRLYYLLNEQALMLVMCKVLSLLFFKGMLLMFTDAGNNTQVLLVALLTSVLCHAVLMFTLLKFEIDYLNFSKSLPIPAYKRLLGWLSTFAIILLPEWIFLSISSAYNLYSIICGLLFGLAGLFFLLTLLYMVKLNMDIYLRWILFFFCISMLSILTHNHLLFSSVLLGICALYYLMNFDRIDLKLSLFFIISGAIFSGSCNQRSENVTSNETRKAKETYNLLESYIKADLKKDSILVLQAPPKFITEMCASKIVKFKKSDLSVEELVAQSQSDTTMWSGHEFPGAHLLEYDQKTNSAKSADLINRGDKNGYYVFSRPVFSKDFNFAILQSAFVCGPRCGQGETILFEKKERTWHRLKSFCRSVY
ncbi:hypothetical protein [Pedobacter hartonius]|uniref:hypothetical protein n=1 Tax=Pedobacter hartonius TaxID=425514 RepID=UPI0011153BE9|nr:hypothetical protein [Pedobacter hartonius]